MLLLDISVWGFVLQGRANDATALRFLDVGQGDSSLMTLPGGITILTDAGPPRSASRALDEVMSSGTHYIDLAILSHPQLDHMGGFVDLLDRYDFGAFLWNGREDAAAQDTWSLIKEKLHARGIPMIMVFGGDAIRVGDARIDFLAPDAASLVSKELNDTGLVEYVYTPHFTALLTADIDARIERALAEWLNVRADILKVAHHGSKYSSSKEFLSEVRPKLAAIGVGRNRYGHPTKEALARLATVGAQVFRTDQHGTIRVLGVDNTLKVFVDKP